MAHARRKFHDLYEANGSEITQQALVIIAHLYDIERETRTLEPDEGNNDEYVYLEDVMTRLPTQPYSQIADLLPHNWQPQTV